MSSVVLDASAVLAVVHEERGRDLVFPLLRGSSISAVNHAEVLKKLVERGSNLAVSRHLIGNFGIAIVPFDHEQAAMTAELWPRCREKGLSFADRACLALGLLQQATIVTSDRAWKSLELGLKVETFR